ncbi:MAG: hypothetical protein MUP02_08130 [Actinobacteria bacterium]|nr:hypothetical protein [Actinomycetota bacterium]
MKRNRKILMLEEKEVIREVYRIHCPSKKGTVLGDAEGQKLIQETLFEIYRLFK